MLQGVKEQTCNYLNTKGWTYSATPRKIIKKIEEAGLCRWHGRQILDVKRSFPDFKNQEGSSSSIPTS